VIVAVETFDLDAFYSDYRQDGHGRPAHDAADDGVPAALRLRDRTLFFYVNAAPCRATQPTSSV
jgi:hypothetical protein